MLEFIEKTFGFFSRHFELIVGVWIYAAIALVSIFLVASLRDLRPHRVWGFLRRAFNGLLFWLLAAAQVAMVVILVGTSLFNFIIEKPVFDASLPISAGTSWVRSDQDVYYIAGNTLMRIELDGDNLTTVYEADTPVREYSFSPDGRKLLVVTARELVLLSLFSGKTRVLDSLPQAQEGTKLGGVISGVRWAPDSRHLVYRTVKWSRVAAVERWLLADTERHDDTREIRTGGRKTKEIYWSSDGEALYLLDFKALDRTVRGNPFDVSISRIPVATLRPEPVAKFPAEDSRISENQLLVYDVRLFDRDNRLSFSRDTNVRLNAVSTKGGEVGIDAQDRLYYKPGSWWSKYMYRVPRAVFNDDPRRHQYRNGDLVIYHLRWLPGGRYVIMGHRQFGMVVLDPRSEKMSILKNEPGTSFGWYEPLPES